MASEWFYARDGQKHGPYSSPQLRAMAQSGELLRTDLIWKKGMADWRPAGETTQLFAGVREDGKTQSKAKATVAESGGAEATVPQPKGLKAAAQAAARATQLAAERTTLTTVSLPAAYLELGKHCYDSRAYASDFPKEMSELDQLEARLSAEAESTNPTSASSWSDRAKALAGKGLDFAQKQKASLEKAASLRRLGKLAYEKYGSDAGPSEVCEVIRRVTSRVAEIDQHHSSPGGTAGKKSTLSRYVVACAAFFAVMCLIGAVQQAIAPRKPDSPDSSSASSSRQTPVTDISDKASTPSPQMGEGSPNTQPRLSTQTAPSKSSRPVAAARPARGLDPESEELLKKLLSHAVKELDSDNADIGAVLRVVLERGVKGSDLEWLTRFPTIESLSLPRGPVALEMACDYVYEVRQLRTLDAGQCVLTLDNLRTLADRCPELDSLAFSFKCLRSEEAYPFDAVINTLAAFPKLRCLAVTFYDLKDKHLSAASSGIVRKCKGLSFLEISHNGRFKAQPILEAIRGHSTLQTLRLDHHDTRGCNFECLADCGQLTKLVVADAYVEQDVVASAMIPKLTHLWLAPEARKADQILMQLKKTRPGLYQGDARQKDVPTWSGSVLPLSKKSRKVVFNQSYGVHFKEDE